MDNMEKINTLIDPNTLRFQKIQETLQVLCDLLFDLKQEMEVINRNESKAHKKY